MPASWDLSSRHNSNHTLDRHTNVVEVDTAVLSLIAAVVSVVAGFVAVVLYARRVFIQKVYPRSAVLDVLWWGLLVSVPGSLNYAICAALQLRNELEAYCPVSLVIMELFWVPQLMLEGTFFVFIALVASGRRLPITWASKAAVVALSCGLLITLIVFAILSRMPGGIVYGTSLPWCWIPGDDEIPCESSVGSGSSSDHTGCAHQHSYTGVLIGLRLLGGMMWIFVSDFVGVISFVYFAYQLRRYVRMGLLTEVKPAVKLRFFYFFYYLVGTIAIVLQRTGVLPPECDQVMKRVQAFLQPSFAAVNAIVLLGSEREWLLNCGASATRRGLLGNSTEFGYDLYRADHDEDRDEDGSYVSSAATLDYGTRTIPNPKVLPQSGGAGQVPQDQSGHRNGGEELRSATGAQLQRVSDARPLSGPSGSSHSGTQSGLLDSDTSSRFLGFEPQVGSAPSEPIIDFYYGSGPVEHPS